MITLKLEKNAVQAASKLIGVSDTGTAVNNNPQIKMHLEVTSSVSGTYLVETKLVISTLQIPLFQPRLLYLF